MSSSAFCHICHLWFFIFVIFNFLSYFSYIAFCHIFAFSIFVILSFLSYFSYSAFCHICHILAFFMSENFICLWSPVNNQSSPTQPYSQERAHCLLLSQKNKLALALIHKRERILYFHFRRMKLHFLPVASINRHRLNRVFFRLFCIFHYFEWVGLKELKDIGWIVYIILPVLYFPPFFWVVGFESVGTRWNKQSC